MNLIEIALPAGALSADDQHLLAREITVGLTGDEADETAPETTLERARAMTHIGFRELTSWTVGTGPWQPGQVPPVWITVTVPEAWRDEIARHFLGRVRRAVRRLDHSHGWERPYAGLWINLVGIADGSIGLDGKAVTADELVARMTEETRAQLPAGASAPEGMLLDPMCGMQVKDVPSAITLEHDGARYGFCAQSCRAAYLRTHGLEEVVAG